MAKSVLQAQSGAMSIRTSSRKISTKLYRVIFGLIAAIFFFASVPEAVHGREPTTQKHIDTTFSNGLTILALEDKSDPLISLWITYRAGTPDEPEGKSGIMKVAEEIMKSGSRGYREGEYSRVIHSGGGTFGSFSTWDLTCYISRFPKNLLRDVLLMEADRMEGPLILRERLVDA
ncbi:MAG: insulinase family protein, partial [candidate division Zixibacteria bacterium]|nr:insulinase family protein [candidate division Zixibacteria bacterium]